MNHAAIGRCRSCWFLSQVSLWLDALGHRRNIHIFLQIFWFGTAPTSNGYPVKINDWKMKFPCWNAPFFWGGRVNFRWGKSALRKNSYPKLLTLLRSSPVHNPLFSRTAANGHTTSPSLGSSIRINKLTLIFFTTIAPYSPAGSFQPRKHPV